ncbi:MAG: ROK family protein [Parvibaculaceae bacterium]
MDSASAERGDLSFLNASSPSAERVDSEQQSLALILNLVRGEEATTRLEIERISGLGRAIVSDRVATLTELGLVDESELGPAQGGRAPRSIRFLEGAALLLVAHIDQSKVSVALSDLAGKLVFEHHEPLDAIADQEAVLARITSLFDWSLNQHKNKCSLWGVGISVDGPVEQTANAPFSSPRLHFLPTWDGTEFAETLAEKYGAPVWVRNATQMTTLGEFRTGSGRGARDMLFVDLGKEITAGIVCDGRLYRGAQGGAGLIGHTAAAEDSTVLCKCGNTGCLEALAGADAIGRSATKAALDGTSAELAALLEANGMLTPTDVATAAILGDPFSADLLSRSGRLIGTTVAALINAFNPSVIVLGGPWAQQSDILLAAIREAIYRRCHPLVSRDLKIVRSQMSGSATLSGLAVTIIGELFAPYALARWVKHRSPLRHPKVMDALAQIGQRGVKPPDRLKRPDTHKRKQAS